jgi:hypothetical protein
MARNEVVAHCLRMKIHIQDQDTDSYFMLALVYAGENGRAHMLPAWQCATSLSRN